MFCTNNYKTCTNKSYFTFKKIIQDKFSDKFTAVTLIWLVNTFPQKLVYDHYTSMAPDEQVIIIIIINNLYSAKIQKFSGASHSMHNIIKNILIKNIYKINEKIRK